MSQDTAAALHKPVTANSATVTINVPKPDLANVHEFQEQVIEAVKSQGFVETVQKLKSQASEPTSAEPTSAKFTVKTVTTGVTGGYSSSSGGSGSVQGTISITFGVN